MLVMWGLAQVVASVVSFMAAGAGHGTYVPAVRLLPFGALFVAVWEGEGIAGMLGL